MSVSYPTPKNPLASLDSTAHAPTSEPVVTIPLSDYNSLVDDVICIKTALKDYYHIIALLACDYSQLKQWTVQSLIGVMHLNLDIHTDIVHSIVEQLESYKQ